MTGPEHYRAAEKLLSDASFVNSMGQPVTRDGLPVVPGEHEALLARAQVHATLALAAATAASAQPHAAGEPTGMGTDDFDEWAEVIG